MTAPTLSGLGHLAACPGSARFPRQEEERGPEARLGSAIHVVNDAQIRGEWDADARGWGPCVGVEEVAGRFSLDADDAGRLAFLARHMRLPVPAGALSEVSLGYFPDGSVRRIEGGAGHYPDVKQWLSGQVDLMWSEPEPIDWYGDGVRSTFPVVDPGSTLWLCDVKTGEPENVPPPHANWQLRAGAVMAARWTGARRVVVALCFISPASISAALRAAREAREAREKAEVENSLWDLAHEAGDFAGSYEHREKRREHLAAAEAHEREAREGRWEIGETLDGAALDGIEVEMRAVLARARGEQGNDQGGVLEVLGVGQGHVDSEGSPDRSVSEPKVPVPPPLILGAHCTHCHVAPVCPALSAFALTAARQTKADLETLDAATVAGLWAKVPALRRMADAIEVTARTWARKSGGRLRLPDGREYGPAVEERRSYDTARTFDVLLGFISEALANEGAVYTWASIERVLVEAGVSPKRFGEVRKALEKAGAVVVTGAERWGYRQPAKPVEVDDEGRGRGNDGAGSDLRRADLAADGADHRDLQGEQDPDGGEFRSGRGGGSGVAMLDDPSREGVGGAEDVPGGGEHPLPAPADVRGPHGHVGPVAARGPCPICLRTYALRGGVLRAHYQQAPRRGVRCPGSGGPPGEAPIYEAPWLPAPVEPARTEPPAGESPRQLAIVGAG